MAETATKLPHGAPGMDEKNIEVKVANGNLTIQRREEGGKGGEEKGLLSA